MVIKGDRRANSIANYRIPAELKAERLRSLPTQIEQCLIFGRCSEPHIDRPSSVSSITQARSTRGASARCERGVTDLTDPLPAACEASNVSAVSVDGGLNVTRVGDGQ